MQNSESGEDTWQRVDPGEVLAAVEGNAITLVGEATRDDLLVDVVVRPPVFTPNGDGINDEAVFAFKVLRLADDSPVEVTIYDLSGRLLRKLVERRQGGTGQYEIAWDDPVRKVLQHDTSAQSKPLPPKGGRLSFRLN